jgi:hypothetical protein
MPNCLPLKGEVPSGLVGQWCFELKREHRGRCYLEGLFLPGGSHGLLVVPRNG